MGAILNPAIDLVDVHMSKPLPPNNLFDNYVINTFLAWKPRSRESRRNAIGSRFMKMRLPGQERIHA